ncbi:MAG: radical SAM family heme chaperone HemW [Mogibacterium sp.]|nr:radical SAM family heme chaperone HemW [Mogibacterium sp.]MBR4089865.1 radical SAM family heme chaperone HemW [Mogibacterium sp.]
MDKKRGIYIHMPFCVQKCRYCAFLSFSAEGSPRKEYMDALEKEIKLRSALERERGTDKPADTIYIGGGTPSVMDIAAMSEMIKTLKRSFEIKPDAEFTLEANPATLGRKDGVMLAKLQAYKFMGVNRLSMGVQSMDNDRLHYLGRIHTAENVARDMEIIRRKGFSNVNLDLMFSVPGESTEDAMRDLERILALAPEHISCYSLQIEEGTPFGEMAESGELTEVPDEEDRETYHRICRRLRDAGYEHYEISNFAKKGDDPAATSPYRSRHNSLYWNMDEYIGLGLGASGFINGVRYKNTSDLEEYLAVLEEGRLPVAEEHRNTAFDNISEAVFTGLRRREGIRYEDAVRAYMDAVDAERPEILPGDDFRDVFWDIFAEAREEALGYAGRGLLIISDEGLKLTEQGIDISNSIMSLFV